MSGFYITMDDTVRSYRFYAIAHTNVGMTWLLMPS